MKRITELTAISAVAETDLLAAVDVSDTTQSTAGSTRKMTVAQTADYIKARTETLTNKTLTTPVVASVYQDAGKTKLLTIPDTASDTLVSLAATQTLTNKTLTSPKLNEDVAVTVKASELNGLLTGWIPAGETWTYASADAPTFTFTVAADVTAKYSAGMRLKLTQTTVKYFIITAVSAYSGGNTTITVYGGTDYTLANAAITNPSYSTQKAPFGFPLDPDKWTVEVVNTSSLDQSSPTQSVWYNLGSLSISVPIGAWNVSYALSLRYLGTGAHTGFVTLSTGNNTESNANYTVGSLGFTTILEGIFMNFYLSVTSKTAHYLNAKAGSSGVTEINFRGTFTPTIIQATCAYL